MLFLLLVEDAIQRNNEAVTWMESGYYSNAIVAGIEALNCIGYAIRSITKDGATIMRMDQIGNFPKLCHQVENVFVGFQPDSSICRGYSIYKFSSRLSVATSTTMTSSPSSPQDDDDDDDDDDDISSAHASMDMISSSIILNLALSYHLHAYYSTCSSWSDRNEALRKAEQLYFWAYEFDLMVGERESYLDETRIMAVLNNLAHVHVLLDHPETAEQCQQQLLSFLLYVTDREMSSVCDHHHHHHHGDDNDDHSNAGNSSSKPLLRERVQDFLDNVCHLLLGHSICSPAA